MAEDGQKKNRGVRNGRNKIFQKTNFHCWYCGIYLTKKKGNTRTIDHKVPVSKGGETIDSNLVPCCQPCNVEKDNLGLTEYRKLIQTKHMLKKLPKFFGEGRRTGVWIRCLSKI